MRLAFVTGTPTAVRLGSGTAVGIQVLRRAVERLGHEVTMVTPRTDRAPLGLTAWRFWFNLALTRRAWASFDLVVGFDLDGFLLPSWSLGNYLVSIKGVLAEELTFERGAVRRLLQLQSWCEARNVRRASLVVTTSRYAAGKIGERYHVPEGRLRLVPELIDLDVWSRQFELAPSAASASPTILSVAHMYPRKSLDTLLRAVALLPDRWREARVHLVGVGPEFERWRGLARDLGLGDRAKFLGHVSRARLVQEYRDCALFCLPSRQEGFGIVFLEAMAAGKAVVASRAAAVPEVVQDGRTGLLVPPGDPLALAGAITELLDDPERRRRLGDGGRQAVERYDAPRIARRFLDVCEEARSRGAAHSDAVAVTE